MIKNYLNIFFIIIIFILLIIIYSLNNLNLRCSNIGEKILDDIFGLEVGKIKCEQKAIEEQKVHLKNNPFPESGRYIDTTGRFEVDCPKNTDIIVFLGQSNSANYYITENYSRSENLNYFNGKCYKLEDPILGAQGWRNSLLPSLSSKLETKKTIIFLSNGWGGTSITEWSDTNSMLTRYARMNINDLLVDNNLKFIIWIQGEEDAWSGIDYISHFDKFKRNLLAGLDVNKIKELKFINTLTGICSNKKIDPSLVKQQRELGFRKEIITSEVTLNLDLNFRYDFCHYNKYGTEIITDELAKIINKYIYD